MWYNCAERTKRSEGHFWGSLNYVHHNPVKHGYAKRWQDWPFSSATVWLDAVGREKAEKIWRSYPLFDYGKDWDND